MLRNLLLAAMLLLASSCALVRPPPVQSTLSDSRLAVTHILYGDHSCSAFHIGNGKFITAAHCFGEDLGGPMEEVRMIDARNFHYFPKVQKYSAAQDLVLLSVYEFNGPALELWDNNWDGEIPMGMEMVALGYPGYYDIEFQWEHGYVKDVVLFRGVEMVVSMDASHPGQSGGPAISTSNGKVLGMVDAGIEVITWRKPPMHTHVSLSVFVSAREIRVFLKA